MVDLLLGEFCWLFCGCWFGWCCSLCLLLWQMLFGFKVVLMVLGLVVFVWCMVLVWVWLLCLGGCGWWWVLCFWLRFGLVRGMWVCWFTWLFIVV